MHEWDIPKYWIQKLAQSIVSIGNVAIPAERISFLDDDRFFRFRQTLGFGILLSEKRKMTSGGEML